MGDKANVISVDELKRRLVGLRDDDFVGMDEGGLTVLTEDGVAWIEIGGLSEEDE